MDDTCKPDVDPTRTCAYCEYFDGGGQARIERARATDTVLHGDCLNRRSPRFTTDSTDTCPEFYPEDDCA